MSHRRLPRHIHQPEDVQTQTPYVSALNWVLPDWESLIRRLQSCTLLSLLADAFFKANAESRAKFENLFVTTALIENAAITNAKIANLAVDSAKIQDLAVTNAKIANLAVDAAKIADATITNLKIVNNTITFENVNQNVPYQFYYQNKKLVASFEALTGYDTVGTSGSGSVTAQKNNIIFATGATQFSVAMIEGYPIMTPSFDPKFKGRMNLSSTSYDLWFRIMLGGYEQGFGFQNGGNAKLGLSNVSVVINQAAGNRCGLFDNLTSESNYNAPRGTYANENRIRANLYRLNTSGQLTLIFTTAWTVLPTTRGIVTIDHSYGSSLALSAGEALYVKIELTNDGGISTLQAGVYITFPWQATTIPSCTYRFHLDCYDNTGNGNIYFYYGGSTESDFRILTGIFAGVSRLNANRFQLYPFKIADTNKHIVEGNWTNSSHTVQLYFDGTKIAGDTYWGTMPDPLKELCFWIENISATDFTLTVSYYAAQEAWA